MTLMIFEMSWMFLFFLNNLGFCFHFRKGCKLSSLFSHVFACLNCFRVVVDAA